MGDPELAVDPDAGTAPTSPLDARRLLALLHRRDVALAHHHHALARALGITATEVRALSHLAHAGELATTELAERLDLSSAGATALAQRLVVHGHVSRHPHPDDRRSTVLRVTPATAGALADADEPLRVGLDALTAGLRGAEAATLAAFLRAIADLYESLPASRRGERGQTAGALQRPVPSSWA
jgi:DNA-binding MarR family transcriptional regulator